ncbi:MAG: DUF348 domain-containing protein [Clostridia bacterium]|nr:DUF348 domain-containing protein [Clostridia bacterium]
MRTLFLKIAGFTALLIVSTMLFCSCASGEADEVLKDISANIIIEVDGKKITVEDAEGRSVKDLLKEARINLNEGDVLSLDENVKVSGDITVKVLRRASVTVEDEINGEVYTVVLTGGTVADALEAVGIKLGDSHTTNYALSKALVNDMEIIVSVKEEPETTEYNDENSENDDSDYDSDDSYYTPPATTKAPSTTKAPVVTAPPTTKAPVTTKPATTKPAPTTAGRTVVNVEIYEDCDGSGHGVKVITYSDGTQEEVAF